MSEKVRVFFVPIENEIACYKDIFNYTYDQVKALLATNDTEEVEFPVDPTNTTGKGPRHWFAKGMVIRIEEIKTIST